MAHRLTEVSAYHPHFGEEAILVGHHSSGTIFLRPALLDRARLEKISGTSLPKTVVVVPTIPLLTSGKVDDPAARTLAEKKLTRHGETTR